MTSKRKKAPPAGLTAEEEALLKKAKKRAYRLDMSLFNLCGIRFGWSSVIGILPGIGDIIDLYMAWMLVGMCKQGGHLKGGDESMMAFNMAIDFGIGLVPFLGDLADGIYKCNTRNVAILEKRLAEKGSARIAAQRESSRLKQEADLAQGGPPPQYTQQLRQPDVARGANETRGGRGWFGGRQEQDVEAGREVAPMKPPRR